MSSNHKGRKGSNEHRSRVSPKQRRREPKERKARRVSTGERFGIDSRSLQVDTLVATERRRSEHRIYCQRR
jgi:hypothetical protein